MPVELFGLTHCNLQPNTYEPEFKITNNDYTLVDRSYEALIDMKKRNGRILNSTLFLENSRKFLKIGQVNWQCDADKLYLSINPEGGFSICHRFDPIELSSLKELITYSKSPEFESKRKELVENCSGCMRPCWAEITHMMIDKKSFWEMAKIEISTWKRRRFGPYEILIQKKESLGNENITYKSTNKKYNRI